MSSSAIVKKRAARRMAAATATFVLKNLTNSGQANLGIRNRGSGLTRYPTPGIDEALAAGSSPDDPTMDEIIVVNGSTADVVIYEDSQPDIIIVEVAYPPGSSVPGPNVTVETYYDDNGDPMLIFGHEFGDTAIRG